MPCLSRKEMLRSHDVSKAISVLGREQIMVSCRPQEEVEALLACLPVMVNDLSPMLVPGVEISVQDGWHTGLGR